MNFGASADEQRVLEHHPAFNDVGAEGGATVGVNYLARGHNRERYDRIFVSAAEHQKVVVESVYTIGDERLPDEIGVSWACFLL